MKINKFFVGLFSVLIVSACGEAPKTNQPAVNNTNTSAATPAVQNLTVVERPQKIKDQMAARGEQDNAAPTLKIIEPKADSTVASSTVKVSLELSGDLKGYMPHMDDATKMGNHVHVILDNQPYEAYYEIGKPFELRNVTDGDHTLRVFPSRPWHESYKNAGAFQVIKFKVKSGGADPAKPTTTANGNTMANANASTTATPEGKDVKPSNSGPVDVKKPLLTYSRPKGDYNGSDADAIMIDFWLTNAKLVGDGGEYRVRYSVDAGEEKFLDKWAPIWLSGWTSGTRNVKLDLIDKDGNVVENSGYNSTTREITVAR